VGAKTTEGTMGKSPVGLFPYAWVLPITGRDTRDDGEVAGTSGSSE
jgi:hypothetical protein